MAAAAAVDPGGSARRRGAAAAAGVMTDRLRLAHRIRRCRARLRDELRREQRMTQRLAGALAECEPLQPTDRESRTREADERDARIRVYIQRRMDAGDKLYIAKEYAAKQFGVS